MSKVIWKDGKPHRRRRGKLVEIPEEWLGKVPHPQTIRKRQSKQPRKIRMQDSKTPRHQGTKASQLDLEEELEE